MRGLKKRELTAPAFLFSQNTKDQPSIDEIFQDLDTDKDKEVSFEEFVVLVSRVLKTAHENIHKE